MTTEPLSAQLERSLLKVQAFSGTTAPIAVTLEFPTMDDRRDFLAAFSAIHLAALKAKEAQDGTDH